MEESRVIKRANVVVKAPSLKVPAASDQDDVSPKRFRKQASLKAFEIVKDAHQQREELIESAKKEIDGIVLSFRRQLDERLEKAIEEKGLEMSESYRQAEEQLGKMYQEQIAVIEAQVLSILVDVYKRFFGEIFEDPENVLKMIRVSLERFSDVDQITIKVAQKIYGEFSTFDMQEIRQLKERFTENLELVSSSDPNFSGYEILTDKGNIDGTLQGQLGVLSEIEENK